MDTSCTLAALARDLALPSRLASLWPLALLAGGMFALAFAAAYGARFVRAPYSRLLCAVALVLAVLAAGVSVLPLAAREPSSRVESLTLSTDVDGSFKRTPAEVMFASDKAQLPLVPLDHGSTKSPAPRDAAGRTLDLHKLLRDYDGRTPPSSV
jgi:hypothetical protein